MKHLKYLLTGFLLMVIPLLIVYLLLDYPKFLAVAFPTLLVLLLSYSIGAMFWDRY